jgi:hypothetical protein
MGDANMQTPSPRIFKEDFLTNVPDVAYRIRMKFIGL